MRKTLDQLGIHNFFYYPRGRFNAITDVDGIRIGHTTLIKGQNIRTGVTVIIPADLDQHKYIAGGFAFNANGEMMGLQLVFEEARLTGPIFLTNTLAIGDVFSAVIDYYKDKIVLPLIGECWDGYLNDIWGRHIKPRHVISAIESAKGGNIEQGSVGAGTGMKSFGFKSGIGTASRKLVILKHEYVVGVLVNNNMGNEDGRHKYLRIGGVDVGKIIGTYDHPKGKGSQEIHQSSSVLVIATNTPLDHHQLNRLARHAVLGLGRIGLISYSGSGDFVIAFSTANKIPQRDARVLWRTVNMSEALLDDVFEATLEAVEEAYLNSLLTAEDMEGRNGHKVKALPIEVLLQHLRGF